ncbi:unnamed protein product [Symbiodinium sp. CCMP2456]|nr:unnamed protein product [Symbiodinium sp. CCMP2456]
MGLSPNFKAVVRCCMHASQKALENAIKACKPAQKVIDDLIFAYSSSSTTGQAKDLGGLSRALRNSCKVNATFMRYANEFDAVLEKACKVNSFAAQRFNTILEVSQGLIWNVTPLVSCLVEIHKRDDRLRAWAAKMLQALCPKSLILLSLLAELAACASKFCHAFDNAKKSGKRSSITRTAGLLVQLKDELQRLFYFQRPDGSFQEPLCLAEHYTAGFLQLLQRSYSLLETNAHVENNRIVFYHGGAKSQANLQSMVATALGTIQTVIEAYLAGLDGEFAGLAYSLQPFDCESWQKHCSDDALWPCRTMSIRVRVVWQIPVVGIPALKGGSSGRSRQDP